jgi:hypothetical protein
VWGSGCIDPILLTSALAGSEWSASRPRHLTSEERAPGTHWIGGWVDPRAGQGDVEKRKFLTLRGLELLPLGRPARSQSPYRLRYPGSLTFPIVRVYLKLPRFGNCFYSHLNVKRILHWNHEPWTMIWECSYRGAKSRYSFVSFAHEDGNRTDFHVTGLSRSNAVDFYSGGGGGGVGYCEWWQGNRL